MAAFVQAKRDLGCKAAQVTVLEEGINTDSRWAKEFWSLLGGHTKYRGSYSYIHFFRAAYTRNAEVPTFRFALMRCCLCLVSSVIYS